MSGQQHIGMTHGGPGAGIAFSWPGRNLELSVNLRWAFERLGENNPSAAEIKELTTQERKAWFRWWAFGPFGVLKIWWPSKSIGTSLFFKTPSSRSEFVVAPIDWRLALRFGAHHSTQRIWLALGPFRLCSYTQRIA